MSSVRVEQGCGGRAWRYMSSARPKERREEEEEEEEEGCLHYQVEHESVLVPLLLEALVRLAALRDLLKELVVALVDRLVHPRPLLNLLLRGEPLLIGGRRPLPSHDLWLKELLAEVLDRTGDDLNDDDKRELAQVLHSMRIEQLGGEAWKCDHTSS